MAGCLGYRPPKRSLPTYSLRAKPDWGPPPPAVSIWVRLWRRVFGPDETTCKVREMIVASREK